ncbi:hypothetical protein V6N12_024234 [Hibiscus sabdariffa]|uniref:RNase H type-1 domain-containing protein n=1 Tax=Hibiscus sabdariffa TaxID=183260 RepID=A0ABR2G0T8_9ROSI
MHIWTSSMVTAEALACIFGLQAAILDGWDSIIVESDNTGKISRLKSKSPSCWESASIEKDVISCSNELSNISFSFVSRVCNQVANWATKHTKSLQWPDNWMDVLPAGLVNVL